MVTREPENGYEEVAIPHRTEESPTIRNKKHKKLLGHGGTCPESQRWEGQGLISGYPWLHFQLETSLNHMTNLSQKMFTKEKEETKKKRSLETGKRVQNVGNRWKQGTKTPPSHPRLIVRTVCRAPFASAHPPTPG